VSFLLEGEDPEQTKMRLGKRRINVSVSPRRWTFLDMEARKLRSLVRASVHYYNTEEEVTRFSEAVGAGR